MARIGLVLVTINPAYRSHDLKYALRQSNAKVLALIEPFKVEPCIKFVDAFPTTVTSKIHNFKIPEQAVKELGLEEAARSKRRERGFCPPIAWFQPIKWSPEGHVTVGRAHPTSRSSATLDAQEDPDKFQSAEHDEFHLSSFRLNHFVRF